MPFCGSVWESGVAGEGRGLANSCRPLTPVTQGSTNKDFIDCADSPSVGRMTEIPWTLPHAGSGSACLLVWEPCSPRTERFQHVICEDMVLKITDMMRLSFPFSPDTSLNLYRALDND
ncbi:E3 Ubiquitin-Protein Ligase Herc2 [Manis pentadactyla]|nr:E3 Ubiquitin-Protein Ligase Herc2 [Manis pentadactyla]